MYILGRWLLPGEEPGDIAVTQPVTMTVSEFWTDDFVVAAAWFRAQDAGKRMQLVKATKAPRAPRKPKARDSRTSELF